MGCGFYEGLRQHGVVDFGPGCSQEIADRLSDRLSQQFASV